MTPASWFWTLVAWASLPLLAILAGVIFARKLGRKFPFFLTYVCVAFLVGVIRLIVFKAGSQRAYFYAYWCSDVIVVVAALLAIYEIFLRRIFPGFAAVRFYRYLFPTAAVLIAFGGCWIAIQSSDVRAAFQVTSHVLDFIRSAVIGFFVAVIVFMGRRFTGNEFSIAAGFGIQAAVTVANAALGTRFPAAATVLNRLDPLAFDLSCLIWLSSFSRRSKPVEPGPGEEVGVEALHQARAAEQALKDFLTPRKQ